MDVALQDDVLNFHEALFECATTAWISADAFLGEEISLRRPAITACLEIAAASAALGKNLMNDSGAHVMKDFRMTLEKAIRILDDHCHNAEHCMITLKCWKQTASLLSK